MIIPRKDTRIIVQGITGKQGTFWTERMQEYGAAIVGGVNPKKAGIIHCGVSVYASAKEAAGGILMGRWRCAIDPRPVGPTLTGA